MKVQIIGDVFIITSSLTVADIALVAKHKPSSLRVMDGEGAEAQEKFAVSFNEGKSSLASFGITFGGKTRCDKGYATYTGKIPADVADADDAKSFVADTLSSISAHIEAIEKAVPTAVKEAAKAKETLLASITVLDGGDSKGDK